MSALTAVTSRSGRQEFPRTLPLQVRHPRPPACRCLAPPPLPPLRRFRGVLRQRAPRLPHLCRLPRNPPRSAHRPGFLRQRRALLVARLRPRPAPGRPRPTQKNSTRTRVN